MNRKAIFNEVEAILERYCEDCFLINKIEKIKERTLHINFVFSQCTVGEKISQCGEKLPLIRLNDLGFSKEADE